MRQPRSQQLHGKDDKQINKYQMLGVEICLVWASRLANELRMVFGKNGRQPTLGSRCGCVHDGCALATSVWVLSD